MTERRWHEIWMEQCEAPAAIRVRYGVESSFLYYTIKRLGLETDPAAREPHDQQIVLLNREAVQTVLAGQYDGARV